MIPYSTQEAVKIVDMVNDANVNATRYSLLDNDLSLSATFVQISANMSCFDLVTSVYSTVASHSGYWNESLANFGDLERLVRSDNVITPGDNRNIPVWNATDPRHLDDIRVDGVGRSLRVDQVDAPSKAELINIDLDWQYRVPTCKVAQDMINSVEYGKGGKTWCSQEYNESLYSSRNGVLDVYKDDVALWRDPTPGQNVIGKDPDGIVLNTLPTKGGVVGIPAPDYDVTVPNVGQICYCQTPTCVKDNTLYTKAISLHGVNSPEITDNFGLTTFTDEMVLHIDVGVLKSKLNMPVVILSAYKDGSEKTDYTEVASTLEIVHYYNACPGVNEVVTIGSNMTRFPYVAIDGNGFIEFRINCIPQIGCKFDHWEVIEGTMIAFNPNIYVAETLVTYPVGVNLKLKIQAVLINA